MASRRRVDELFEWFDDAMLQELAEDANAVGGFLYMAPNEAAARTLQRALRDLRGVEDVEARKEVEVWLVAVLAGSPGSSTSDRRTWFAGMKRVAPAHGCRFLGWRILDRRSLIPPPDGDPNELSTPRADPAERRQRDHRAGSRGVSGPEV
jgi:hypothetical protein